MFQKVKPYKHQIEDFERFKDASVIGLGGEMGTGKSGTLLMIAEHKYKKGDIDALLIVAPNDVHYKWAHEDVPMWLQDVEHDCQCLWGRGGDKKLYRCSKDVFEIKSVNVDTFSTKKKWMQVVDWAATRKIMIAIDEATCVKNPNSLRTQRLIYEFNDVVRRKSVVVTSRVKSVARAVLTGTPVTNSSMDLWSIMEFAKPNYFNRNWYAYQQRYGMFRKHAVMTNAGKQKIVGIPISEEIWDAVKQMPDYETCYNVFGVTVDTFQYIHSQDVYAGAQKHTDELKRLIDPVWSFRLLDQCVSLPRKHKVVAKLHMTEELREVYDAMRFEMIAQYGEHTMTAANKMAVYLRTQQISAGFICDKYVNDCADVDVVDFTPQDPIKWVGNSSPKIDMLKSDINEGQRPVIIATRFTAEAARLFDELEKDYSTCLITGWKRVGSIPEFQKGKFDVMVANIVSISHGHNLQNSNKILVHSNTPSLERRLQLEGRIRRAGQKRVQYYKDYVYYDSVDEKILESQRQNKELLDYIRGVKDIKGLVA